MLSERPRLHLTHTPTPLIKRPVLDARWGIDLWFKRDDTIGGAEGGNKLRKLEFLLADALAKKADTVITCGALQSNHARATALVCASLGLKCVLFLRVRGKGPNGEPLGARGNLLLDRLAGAEIHRISPADYEGRTLLMNSAASTLERAGRRPYVIPEGGSNAVGSLGYIDAMREVRDQLAAGLAGGRPFDEVVHACGSGGTLTGTAVGCAMFGPAARVRAVAVCDTAAYFEGVVKRIVLELGYYGAAIEPAPFIVDEAARGPQYGVASDEQLGFLVEITRSTGLVFDPVYTGKALHAVHLAALRGEYAKGARILFLHTGGLPGLLAEGDAFEKHL